MIKLLRRDVLKVDYDAFEEWAARRNRWWQRENDRRIAGGEEPIFSDQRSTLVEEESQSMSWQRHQETKVVAQRLVWRVWVLTAVSVAAIITAIVAAVI